MNRLFDKTFWGLTIGFVALLVLNFLLADWMRNIGLQSLSRGTVAIGLLILWRTLMEMMVVSAATAETEYTVTGNGYAPEGEVRLAGGKAQSNAVLELFARNSLLCNDAEIF